MIASLKTYFLGLIRLSLILTPRKTGVTPKILPGAGRLNNPKRLDYSARQVDWTCIPALLLPGKPGSRVAG